MAPVDIILIGYDPAWTVRAAAHCRRTFDTLDLRRRLLIVNSSLKNTPPLDDWTAIQGGNSLGEFSGWQQALDMLRAGEGLGTTIFVNDTVGAYRHLPLFTRVALRQEIRALQGKRWIGFSDMDAPPAGRLVIDGLDLPEWASSYCFVLTADSVRQLDWKLYDAERVAACVNGGTDEARFFSDRLSPDLRRHLRWWLFEGGWHRSEPLDESNSERMVFKARCICAELLLSARCLALGITFHEPLRRHPWAGRLNRVAAKMRSLLQSG